MATIAKMAFLRPVLASIELARKASMARIQGLKPAKRPAAKTTEAEDRVRFSKAFSAALLAHVGEAIVVFVKLLLSWADEKIMLSTTIGRITVALYRKVSIPDYLNIFSKRALLPIDLYP